MIFNLTDLQIQGASLGKKFASPYANVAERETLLLQKCKYKPLSYLGYLDVIFVGWLHTRKKFDQLILLIYY